MTYSWGVQKNRRRFIEVWLFFLLLFSVSFFELTPILNLIGPNGSFTFCLLTLFFCFTFNRRAWIRDSKEWLHPFWWFIIGVVLSFIPAYYYYGQSPVQSFFTYRRFFQFVAFPIFIAIRPSEREFRTALCAYAVIYLCSVLFVTFLAPGWVVVNEHTEFVDEGDFVHSLGGIRLLSLAFIFAFYRLIQEFSWKYLFWVLFLFGILFLIQNRTSLIAVIFIVGYALASMKASPRKLVIIIIVSLALLLMILYTASQWEHLYRLTVEQILNPDYNRNKALVYMFSKRQWMRDLLGDGFISANVSNLVPNLQENGIFFSDVGLAATWNQYGVITVGTILIMTINAFIRKKSFLVKSCAIYTLTGTLTMSYFGISESLVWLAIYLYLYYSDGHPRFSDTPSKKRFTLSAVPSRL